MSKRVAGMLRGHARLLDHARQYVKDGEKDAAMIIVDGVIANLRRDADDEEQRGQDWYEQYKAELRKMGIPEGERKISPPRQEPWL